MELEKTLLSVEEFCTYMGIGKTKARELLSNPGCKYVVRIGRRVLIHKELFPSDGLVVTYDDIAYGIINI